MPETTPPANDRELQTTVRKKLDRRLKTIGWGLFFVWMGLAFLFNMGCGLVCIGVGLIILGKFAVKEYLSGAIYSRTTNESC